MKLGEIDGFTRASELRDDYPRSDGWDCINGYTRCPGLDGDRPPCDECRIIGQLLGDEVGGRDDG